MEAKIEHREGRLIIPDHPIITFIEGDGIGVDITPAALKILDAAVEKAYQKKKKIFWKEVYAGEKALKNYGTHLPEATLSLIKEYKVSIKGPLTTPVGGGIRSINVALRQVLDLYACVRPVNYTKGVPSPMKNPERLNIVIFRENTEDVYAGIEFEAGSEHANALIDLLKKMGKNVVPGSSIGIKPMSKARSERLVRKAIQYAIQHNRRTVTLVHKGNIMKFTEGYFKNWGFELAAREFREYVVTEGEVEKGATRQGKILINDRIADSMFQQILLRPEEYDVIATSNLNGDYLSDAAAAQVGGLGMAPGANMSDEIAVFEATHGTAPKYAGLDQVNPCSVLLSGVMLLEHLQWEKPAIMIKDALVKTILQKKVTYDLARQFTDVKPLRTSEFAHAVIENL